MSVRAAKLDGPEQEARVLLRDGRAMSAGRGKLSKVSGMTRRARREHGGALTAGRWTTSRAGQDGGSSDVQRNAGARTSTAETGTKTQSDPDTAPAENPTDGTPRAAGALTLSEKPQTSFDKYIDEIVHYFAQESKDIIIFEDPNVFEALRELNVLMLPSALTTTGWTPRACIKGAERNSQNFGR